MSASSPSLATYARRLERELGRRSGRASVLSPRDWKLATAWHARGVPLALILETLDAVEQERRGHGRGPRGLASIAPAVEEAWRVVRAGRAVAAAPTGSTLPSRGSVVEAWRRAAAGQRPGSPLALLVHELLARLAAGDDTAVLDAELDRRLAGVCSPDRVVVVRRRLEARLEPQRGRMEAGAWQAMLARALADALRREAVLPRLSLSDPEP